MANRFLNNIRINDAYTFPASDGNDGQVITTDGAGNLAFENISPDAASVIYRDNFTGDGSTVTFDLQNSITDEDQTQIYIDGVYQEKSTYSISGTTITFTTAPISGHSVEVISISSINTGPTVLYQDNFTGNGSATAFTLGQEIDNEIKTFIFLNGVYQFKNTYTVDGATLTFDTAPANGVDIEVVSIASAVQSDSLQAGAVIIPVKNTHTASISKGTPVYITGNVGASERLQIAPADASNSAKMPAAGLLLQTLAVNAEGYVITGGYLRNITTDTIDGTSTASNDTVYVKAGGGLTMTKPTGSNLIQNIAKIARSSSGSSGSLLVSSILRTNDVPNLTTGKIWVGDSNTVESTVVHLDESNNRLGVNNNSPNYSLDVTGDANISSNVIIGGNLTVDGTQTILNTQTVEVEDNILQLNTTQGSPDTATATTSGISVYRGDGVTQASFIFDDADDTWDLTNNLVVDGNATFAGKILVGTGATAAASLNAYTQTVSANLYSALRIIENSGASSYWDIGATGGGLPDLNFYVNGGTTPKLTIDSSGNVGIGVSNPSDYYSTANDLVVGGSSNHGITIATGTTSTGALHFADGTSGAAEYAGYIAYQHNDNKLRFGVNASDKLVIDSSGNVGIGTTSPSAKLTVQGTNSANGGIKIQNSGGNPYAIYSDNNDLLFTNGNGSSTALTIAYSGNATFAGSVGIGLANPSWQLEVQNTGTVRHAISSTNNGTAGVFFRVFNSGTQVGNGTIRTDNGGNMSFWTGTSGESEKMLIDSAGNVGIGTSSPQRELHLHTSSSGGSFIAFTNDTTGQTSTDGAIVGIDSSEDLRILQYENKPIRFSTNGSERMRIDSSGNVGIGTTSPGRKLTVTGDVSGDANNLLLSNENDTNGDSASIGFSMLSNNTYVKSGIFFERTTTQGRGSLHLAVNNEVNGNNVTKSDAKLTINNTGNVGIGTTSPAEKLTIDGTVSGAYVRISNAASGDVSSGYMIYNGSNLDFNVYTNPTFGNTTLLTREALAIRTGGSQRMYITSGGNVGIGTTSPAAKLEVKEGHTILGGTQNNYGGNVFTTKLGGYGVLSAGTDRYGSYGWLTFNSNNNYTGGARKFAFTNGYKSNEFALLMGTSDQADPTLGAQGNVANGQLIFHVNNSADFMFGKVAGDGNGPHLQVNSYGYSSTFQGSSTADMVTYKTGTELNTNVGALVFRDNGNDYCGQITVNGATNTTSYLSASDYRLKEDLKDFNGIDLVDKIPVYNFKWKKENVRAFGVLAHELKEVLPLVVDGDKDEEKYQTVDYSKIVPVLIKAIQELKAEIETLKLQING